MEAKKFIGTVLPDGHLSLPDNTAKEIGKSFEVFLIPFEGEDIYKYAENLAKEKGFYKLREDDIEEIIHKSRGIK